MGGNNMIKRKAHIFTSNNEFQEFLDRMDEHISISNYVVNDNGTHYIITEHKMSDEETKQFKINQLKKQIKECNERWEKKIKNYDEVINMYNELLYYDMVNVYVDRREDAIAEYNEEQRKLRNKLEKLVKLDYTGFIR